MSALQVSYIVAWVLLIVLLAAVAMLYSAVGILIRRGTSGLASGPDLASVGPPLDVRVEAPVVRDLNGALFGGVRRWAFAGVTCAGCMQMKQFLRTADPDQLESFALICRGTSEQVSEWSQDLPDWVSVVADEDGSISRLFNIAVTPFYVVLDDHLTCRAKGPTESSLNVRGGERLTVGVERQNHPTPV